MIQMMKRHFDVESDGFYGAYWKCKTGSDCAMIAMIGDDPEDYLARTSVKWLHKLGVNVMTMSPGKKDYDPPAPRNLPSDLQLTPPASNCAERQIFPKNREIFLAC